MYLSIEEFKLNLVKFWVLPPTFEVTTDNVHLTAFLDEAVALRHYKTLNDHTKFLVRTWRPTTGKPILFEAIPTGVAKRHDAPEGSWFVVDLDNRAPITPSGRFYVWSFFTRQEAREFCKYMREQKAQGQNVVNVSAPFFLHQSS